MNLAALRTKIREWDLSLPPDSPADTSKYSAFLSTIDFFARDEWKVYLPAKHFSQNDDILSRLASWIGNVTDEEDQKLLLEFAAKHLAFISLEDLWALEEAAFNGPIRRWTIDCLKIQMDSPDFDKKVNDALNHTTWYCPMTDSMDINEFYHTNHICGIKHRPSFTTLSMLDKNSANQEPSPSLLVQNLLKYIADPDPTHKAPSFERLVLLEDFVGSGTQVASTLKWALTSTKLPILFVPLIICPKGMEKLSSMIDESAGQLTIKPVIELSPSDMLGPERRGKKGARNAEQFEKLAEKTFAAVAGTSDLPGNTPPYTPFGFKSTGCAIVTYSNTPNNSLPLIHHQPVSNSWTPLFPRSTRI